MWPNKSTVRTSSDIRSVTPNIIRRIMNIITCNTLAYYSRAPHQPRYKIIMIIGPLQVHPDNLISDNKSINGQIMYHS